MGWPSRAAVCQALRKALVRWRRGRGHSQWDRRSRLSGSARAVMPRRVPRAGGDGAAADPDPPTGRPALLAQRGARGGCPAAASGATAGRGAAGAGSSRLRAPRNDVIIIIIPLKRKKKDKRSEACPEGRDGRAIPVLSACGRSRFKPTWTTASVDPTMARPVPLSAKGCRSSVLLRGACRAPVRRSVLGGRHRRTGAWARSRLGRTPTRTARRFATR